MKGKVIGKVTRPSNADTAQEEHGQSSGLRSYSVTCREGYMKIGCEQVACLQIVLFP